MNVTRQQDAQHYPGRALCPRTLVLLVLAVTMVWPLSAFASDDNSDLVAKNRGRSCLFLSPVANHALADPLMLIEARKAAISNVKPLIPKGWQLGNETLRCRTYALYPTLKRLTLRTLGKRVQISCSMSLMIERSRKRQIYASVTGGATVRFRNTPRGIAIAKRSCVRAALIDLLKQSVVTLSKKH